jgi:hypothetical protein
MKFGRILAQCLVLCVALAAGARVALAADLEVIDTTKRDQLEDANHAAGGGDAGVGPGEAVSSFNGNLQVTHASSPVLSHDGALSLALTRTYNSNNVRKYHVRYGENDYRDLVAGRGPFGLGWTSHLGRVIFRPRYTLNTDTLGRFIELMWKAVPCSIVDLHTSSGDGP